MSLDTVLQIGKVLRNSENSLKYFKYVESCPKDKDGNWPICITIPVNSDFTFNWDGIKFTPENEREKMYYLKYTTSDNDSSPKKYIFGDICYTRKSEIDKTGKIKGIKDFGNFTFEKGQGNAFINGNSTFEEIERDYLINMISSMTEKKKDEKENLMFFKSIIYGYKNGKPVELPKKLEKYSSEIIPAYQKLKEIENKTQLLLFHKEFESNLNKFNLILLYAPAIEFILSNEKQNLNSYLDDSEIIKDKYLNVILDKNKTIIKRLLAKDETVESFSNETRNIIQQYADFNVFIHFEFSIADNLLSWHHFDDSFKIIKDKLNSEITNLTTEGLVPSKSIYRTLCSGNEKNDIQFPNFETEKSFKSFSFKNAEEFKDFLYTGNILNKSQRRLYNTDIDLFVLPVAIGDQQISVEDYDTFFFDKRDETRLVHEPLFSIFQNEGTDKFNRFDFIFSDSSGNTTNDLIEISGIEKSKLRSTKERIERISREINQEKMKLLDSDNEFNNLKVELSFRNILGDVLVDINGKINYKTNARYKSHLLKCLPSIYINNYFRDEHLLPSFIQNLEYFARNLDKKVIWFNYLDLKYHFTFLLKIQNSKSDKFMEITSSESYQIGLMLGSLARNLSQEINSFEKNYVGNLTRRIGNLSDFIKLKNEIEQKLIMHDKTKYTYQSSYDLAQLVKEFKGRYDKEECAFGFMESYFKPIPKKEKQFQEATENMDKSIINNL